MRHNPIRHLATLLGFAVGLAGDLVAAALLAGDAIAGATDWIPSTDIDKAAFATTFAAGITANPGNYGLSAGDATAFTSLSDAYAAAFATSNDPATRTVATIAAKDAAKNAMVPELRRLGNLIQANPAVSDADKIAIGLTIRDTGPGSQTDVPAPTSFPLIGILSATPYAHTVQFTNSDTPDTNAKPDGAIGMELHVAVSSIPIVDPELIPYDRLQTVNKFQQAFGAGDVGKTAYYAGRWITRRGLVGPWSDIQSMTVAA